MTLGEFRAATAHLDDSIDVFIRQDNDEHDCSLANTAEMRPIVFGKDQVPRKDWATENCLIVTDQY